jgi:hypothetical protein
MDALRRRLAAAEERASDAEGAVEWLSRQVQSVGATAALAGVGANIQSPRSRREQTPKAAEADTLFTRSIVTAAEATSALARVKEEAAFRRQALEDELIHHLAATKIQIAFRDRRFVSALVTQGRDLRTEVMLRAKAVGDAAKAVAARKKADEQAIAALARVEHIEDRLLEAQRERDQFQSEGDMLLVNPLSQAVAAVARKAQEKAEQAAEGAKQETEASLKVCFIYSARQVRTIAHILRHRW